MKKRKFKFVSLYSGCGVLDYGIEQAGFESVLSIEMDKDSCESLKANKIGSNIVNRAIEEVSDKEIINLTNLKPGQLDLLVGGPPCQPYSKSRFYRTEQKRGMGDARSNTLIEYIRVLKLLKPKIFLLENVPAIMSKRQNGAFEYILKAVNDLGYNVKYKVLNSANYGVPQKRERLFIVGRRIKSNFSFPEPTHFAPKDITDTKKQKVYVTAGDVLNDLDTPENASDEGHKAGGKDNALLKMIPPGDNYLFFTEKRAHKNPKFKWRSRYWSFLLKLSPNLPSWTIQARRSNNMGPFHWRNRILRISEIKRLMTVPDNWNLYGNIESQWKQLGNGVPSEIAKHIGIQLRKTIKEYYENTGK